MPWPVSLTARVTQWPGGTGSAARHRVARVDGEVDQHLLELRAVGVHGRKVERRPQGQLDVLADEPPQQAAERADHRVEIEPRRLQHLLAAEGEQLLGQRARALGRLLDQLELAPAHGVGADLREQQLRASGDDGQEVVEVVGDAAGGRLSTALVH